MSAPAEAPTIDAESTDSFDEVLVNVVRSPLVVTAPAELAIGTELGGQFRIERVLGVGGMGTVYRASDQTLGRDVAIKVHHAAGGALRLRREAIAMARLAHPNVVTVFEVGELDRRPFVVMEYVAGTTLRTWLEAEPRTVREILAMLIAAGEGLAAAHDADLMHRDFKPENVMIGADGRARVGDFGLARGLDSKDDPPPASAADRMMSPMTQTGAVLGTPAYMAPEQFAGLPVDARADQFAFCVTAWEALWAERPFDGATFEQLHAALASGTRRAAPAVPRVPARVRHALERGLATDPDARFPTMRALLDALREPVRRRRLLVLVAGGGAMLAIGAFALMRQGSEVACDDAGAASIQLVPRDLPAKMRALGASDAAARIETQLAGFTSALSRDSRLACQAGRQRHEWSPELTRKSENCLVVTARTARELLAGETVTLQTIPALIGRTSMLPDSHPCVEPTYLATSPALPDDPVRLGALITARAELAVGLDELSVHRRDRAQARLDRLATSPAHDDPGIAAGMMLLRANIASDRGSMDEATKLRTDCYYAARAIDDAALTTEVLVALITNATILGGDHAVAETWLRTGLADARRLEGYAPWLAGKIYMTAARAADAAGDATSALQHIAHARSLLPPTDSVLGELALLEGGVAMWSGRVDEGVALYEKAIALDTKRFGPDHPVVAGVLSDYASALLAAERPEQALVVARRAMKITQASADPDDVVVDNIRQNLGAVLVQTDHDDEAQPLLEQARANYVALRGAHTTAVANIDLNLAVIYGDRGELDRALAMLDDALAIDEKLLGPDQIEVAEVLYNLATMRNRKGDRRGALAAAERCAAIYAAKHAVSDRHRLALVMTASIENELGDAAAALDRTSEVLAFPSPPENEQVLAWLDLERGRALLALHRGAEARPLFDTARVLYTKLAMQPRVDEIDQLAKKLPSIR